MFAGLTQTSFVCRRQARQAAAKSGAPPPKLQNKVYITFQTNEGESG